MPLFSFFSGLRPGPRQGLCPWTPLGAASPLPQFAKVVVRRRQGGFLQLPCSLGFRLASSATGGARLRPPPAFEKSGGKPGGKLLLISNGLCRPAAHRERRAWFAGRNMRRKREAVPSSRGGGGGGAQRPQRRGGGRGPRPCVGFAGPPGPQNAAAPQATLPVGRWGAATFRGRGLWPWPLNRPAAGRSPAAGGWA